MTPNDAGTPVPPLAPSSPNVQEPPPLRSPREVKLPLSVRKELLITRAALERYDCVHALHDVRTSVRGVTRIGAWLPRIGGRQSLWKMVGLAREYPILGPALSLGLPLLRRVPVLRWGWKLSKLGLVAGAGYWAWQTWQQVRNQSDAAPRADDIPAGPATAGPSQDTGFHDPLVR